MSFPKKFARGIQNHNSLVDKELCDPCVFDFKHNPLRLDNVQEASINWCDEMNESIQVLLSQKKRVQRNHNSKKGF